MTVKTARPSIDKGQQAIHMYSMKNAIRFSGRCVKNDVRQGRWAVGQGAENNRRLARPMKRAPNPVQPLEVRTEL